MALCNRLHGPEQITMKKLESEDTWQVESKEFSQKNLFFGGVKIKTNPNPFIFLVGNS